MTRVGLRYHVLDRRPDPPRGRGNFLGNVAAHCKVMGPSTMSCAKTAEPIEMLFWMKTRAGLRNHLLDVGADLPRKKGQVSGVVRAIQKHLLCSGRCRVRCKRDHSVCQASENSRPYSENFWAQAISAEKGRWNRRARANSDIYDWLVDVVLSVCTFPNETHIFNIAMLFLSGFHIHQFWLAYYAVAAHLPVFLYHSVILAGSVHTMSSSSSQLVIRRTRLSTVGDRAFPVAGSRLWNSLPPDVTSAPTLTVFRNRLKTFLFSRSFPN